MSHRGVPSPVDSAAFYDRLPESRMSERGSISVFLAVFALALFALVGLVVDGGRVLAARSAAMDDAAQAARVGAGQLSVNGLRSGQVTIDSSAAASAAEQYLLRVGQTGTAVVIGQSVVIRISTTEPTVILGLVGINSMTVSVTASATNVHGVTRQD